MPVKNAIAKNWASWIRGADGILRSDDPWGAYGTMTPVLPQADVDTTYSLPTGNTWTATNTADNNAAGTGTGNRTGCGLQYAVNNCARGDIIETTGSATYTIQLLLKYKATGSGWIYIRPSTHASLPAAGTRAVAADASNMAKLTGAAANTATVVTENYAAYYRIIGHEITTSSTNASPLQAGVVMLTNSDTSDATVPHHIILDRCYVHASSATQHSGKRGVWLDGEHNAVIDSTVSGFYDDGYDSQAILGIQGRGPLLIHNNYLSGASENVMFGGSDPTISGSIPSDITITRNHFEKPTAWLGAGHNVKNLLEFKNAQRVLVEGNVFENNWPDGQVGYSILITPRNQSGTAPWCVTKDITFRLNKGINWGQGFSILGADDIETSERTERLLIENNLFDVTGYGTAQGRLFQILDGPSFLTIRHNTAFCAGTSAFTGNSDNDPVADGFTFEDNIFSNGTIGFSGTATVGATATLAAWYAGDAVFRKNVLIAGTAGQNPADNFFPADNAAVGFTDISGAFTANNYTLTGGSSYHNAASDGTDIGCDIAALNAALA